MITVTLSDDVCNARVNADLTIYNAVKLQFALLQCQQSRRHMVLDLSGVAEIDSAGVQLLLQMRREAAARGLRLRLAECSPPVQEILNLFRLLDETDGDLALVPARQP